jgi:hypothetical protein
MSYTIATMDDVHGEIQINFDKTGKMRPIIKSAGAEGSGL